MVTTSHKILYSADYIIRLLLRPSVRLCVCLSVCEGGSQWTDGRQIV